MLFDMMLFDILTDVTVLYKILFLLDMLLLFFVMVHLCSTLRIFSLKDFEVHHTRQCPCKSVKM